MTNARTGAHFAAAICLCLLTVSPATAASSLPPIKVSPSNRVPECATPGRLMAYLNERNPRLDPRYGDITVAYMRIGEELGVRWDYAFFQMLLETGSLTYKGDVKPEQNNFAGLGATGKGARGERFPDIETGVRAHLQHVLLYAGETIDNPVAERTRNIQAWGVLTKWQQSLKGPVTYANLAAKWAPSSRSYTRDMAAIAEGFYDGACKAADPAPQMLTAARPHSPSSAIAEVGPRAKSKGTELAEQAVAQARQSGEGGKSSLGAGDLAKAAASSSVINSDGIAPEIKILNAAAPTETDANSSGLPPASDTAKITTAAVAGGAKPQSAPKAAKTSCRVWQASYGGSKAIIIRASSSGTTNYTVLDVNEGAEKKEAEAYITAYAKGGEAIGEFPNQNAALDRAFELCPEG